MNKRLTPNNNLLIIVFVLFAIGIFCLFYIDFYDDFVAVKEHDMFWIMYHQGKFKYENGIFLDFFVVGGILLCIWLEQDILNINITNAIIKRIKRCR